MSYPRQISVLEGTGGGNSEEKLHFPNIDKNVFRNKLRELISGKGLNIDKISAEIRRRLAGSIRSDKKGPSLEDFLAKDELSPSEQVKLVMESQQKGFDSETVVYEEGHLRADLLDQIEDIFYTSKQEGKNFFKSMNLDDYSFHIYSSTGSSLDYFNGTDFIVAIRSEKPDKNGKYHLWYTFGDFKTGESNEAIFLKNEMNWIPGEKVVFWTGWEHGLEWAMKTMSREKFIKFREGLRAEYLRDIANKFVANLKKVMQMNWSRLNYSTYKDSGHILVDRD